MEYPFFLRFGTAKTLGIPSNEVGIPVEYPRITPRRGSEYHNNKNNNNDNNNNNNNNNHNNNNEYEQQQQPIYFLI